MTTNLQNIFDAITGHDGSAATDGWREMSRAELIAQAKGQAESCYDPISDDEAARIADAVIARRACVDSCEIDYVRGTLGDAKLLVELVNPVSGVTVERDITDVTQRDLDAYAQLMDNDVRERLHDRLAPCSPAEFLSAYVAEVGPEAAGALILGS